LLLLLALAFGGKNQISATLIFLCFVSDTVNM
jgi:hypothetical protein